MKLGLKMPINDHRKAVDGRDISSLYISRLRFFDTKGGFLGHGSVTNQLIFGEYAESVKRRGHGRARDR